MPAYCLVVPCYNEEARLDVAAFDRFLHETPDASLCFVNDGSRDGTMRVVQSVAERWPARVRVLDLPRNGGKAEAVRQGMLEAHGWKPFAFIGYWDADLATPLDESSRMLRAAVERPTCLLVMGLRLARLGARVTRSTARHYLGRLFATGASLMLHLEVYDTQCGAKLVEAGLVPHLFAEPFSSRWIFDVEVLARLRNRVGAARVRADVIEFPLTTWRGVDGSKIGLASMARAPLELVRLARRYN